MNKICAKCKVEKDISLFHKDKRRKDGHFCYCIDCNKKNALKWKYKNYERYRNANDKYYKENNKKVRDAQKNWYLRNRDKIKVRQKNYVLSIKYKMTIENLSDMLKSQNYKCYICKIDINENKCCIDHDHITGNVRAILCNNCNTGIGMFKDNISFLESAINYLNVFKYA